MNIKFLHIADVHLDSVFAENDIKKASVRRSGLRSSFGKQIDEAAENGASLVLIAGDLFDCEYVNSSTVDFICRVFSSHPEMSFVISPGNHDPYDKNSVYRSAVFPDNVYIFSEEKVDRFDFDELGVSVYGYAFTSRKMTESPLEGFRVGDGGRVNLLCAHCDLGKVSSDYCPVSAVSLVNSGLDYCALGHIHNSDGINAENGTWYGYCGCASGRDYGECGPKGSLLVSIDKNGNEKKVDIKKITSGGHRYETVTADLSGAESLSDAYEIIASLAEPFFGSDVSLRIVLEGIVRQDMDISETYIRERLADRLFSLEVSNCTLPLKDGDAMSSDRTLRGELYRALEGDLKSEDAGRRETAALALRLGLLAINGKLNKR